MDIDTLKTIDKVLGFITDATLIIALFYRQLLLEAGVMALVWLAFDTYVALKTSRLDFLADVLFIAAFIILPFFVPNSNLSALASAIPNIPGASKEVLAKFVVAGGLFVLAVLNIRDIVRTLSDKLSEDKIEL
jgi:hypothetical protein